jgi:glutamine synthetase
MADETDWKQKIENLETDRIKFAVTDIDGVLRGKIISKAKLLKGLDEGLGFCNVIFGWDINDVVYDNTSVSGWHTGYPDSMASIDVDTYRTIP